MDGCQTGEESFPRTKRDVFGSKKNHLFEFGVIYLNFGTTYLSFGAKHLNFGAMYFNFGANILILAPQLKIESC